MASRSCGDADGMVISENQKKKELFTIKKHSRVLFRKSKSVTKMKSLLSFEILTVQSDSSFGFTQRIFRYALI